MKILITIPNWTNPHGGLRVIMEWANRLTKWHHVSLYNLKGAEPCTWFKIDPAVKLCDASELWDSECVILTSPHSSHLLKMILPGQKCFLFLQMMEHMFKPYDLAWLMQCKEFYTAPYPMFSISQWNIGMLNEKFGRKQPVYVTMGFGLNTAVRDGGIETHYIGNGLNFNEFPIECKPKDGKTILVEGWECSNPSKDSECIAHHVAGKLKQEGYKIIAYGGIPLRTNKLLLNEYHYRPTNRLMNEMYSRATIMIKASKYDARSCSPMEAMTKGTVTARAIIQGDDDLINGINCFKTNYDAGELYEAAKILLTDKNVFNSMQRACYEHINKFTWDYWMEKINEILCKD